MKSWLTQEKLKELLHYCPETGAFTWLPRPDDPDWTKRFGGKPAGGIKARGYVSIRLFMHDYYAHRLAFLYMENRMPDEHTDHINHVRTDNRWANLRSVTVEDNGKNKSMNKRNKTGINGVRRCGKVWIASIGIKAGVVYLGGFRDIKEAIAKRKEAEIEHQYHANHGAPLASRHNHRTH